jgi:ATP-dependent Lon protease
MVETRNQKRRNEESENNNSTTVTSIIKKKHKYQPTEFNFDTKDDSSETSSEGVTFGDVTEGDADDDVTEGDGTDGVDAESDGNDVDDTDGVDAEGDDTEGTEGLDEMTKAILKNFKSKFREIAQSKLKKQKGDLDDPYNRFYDNLDAIYSGDFFERTPIEEKKEEFLKKFPKEQIEILNKELEKMRERYTSNCPSVIDILKMNCSLEQKQKLIERIYAFTNSDVLTPEYNSTLKFLTDNIKNDMTPDLLELEERILKNAESNSIFDSYKKKILKSQMPFENKVIAYKKLEIMETYEETDTSEHAKYKNWMDVLLSIPFGTYNSLPVSITSNTDELRSYMKKVRETLDTKLSFLEKPKDQIINIVSQMIRNPDCNINAIGLHGTKGTGKSSIASSIAAALDRPLRTIALGGESDASTLTGHGFTYVGSMPGRFIEILRETKTMSPVILIDEIDKISQTAQGKEIIGTLIHLTDSTTNNKYNYDRYFSGIEFDLSKILFIFTYNDPSKVDPILSDRLYKIKVDNYNQKEKLEITNKHLIRDVLQQLKLDNISFHEDAIKYLVDQSNKDEGMRTIKTKITIILSRINILLLTNESDNILNLKYKKLYSYYKNDVGSDDGSDVGQIVIPKDHIDILLDESISNEKDPFDEPPFGMYL